MPLQNRVDPFGALVADAARGLFMGNRGGRFHRDDRTLATRRWASKQWICCALGFRERHRAVWGRGYTELFFLDEPTALAAGHRPCFECRRKDALAFASAFAPQVRLRPRAANIDDVLHGERLAGRGKRLHRADISDLPDASFVVVDGKPYAVCGSRLLPWTPGGYGAPVTRRGRGDVDVLTPPSIVGVLRNAYRPRWHPSASMAG